MVCERCGRESADAVFCTFCGTRQGGPQPTAVGRRTERYAAHPNEGVLHPAIFTTLFPHLSHHKVNGFRWALFIGVGLIAALYVLGLITAAILMSAILVPVVYVLYLYEVRVYRDTPIPVLGLTLGAGVVIGIVLTLAADALAGNAPLMRSTPFGLSVNLPGVALFLIGVPLLQEILKPVPALFLRGSADFPESIDGLVFGVAAGLGFAAAETLVHFSAVITSTSIQTEPGDWIYPLATIAIFMPLLHGSATGLIAGALWQLGKRPLGRTGAMAIAAALIGHIAFALGTEFLGATGPSAIVPLAWQAIVVGLLLISIRLFLHRALLDEAADLGLFEIVCPNCDSHVTAGAFCPVCGMAVTASPRSIRPGGDTGRAMRSEGA